jgi:MFS family permease
MPDFSKQPLFKGPFSFYVSSRLLISTAARLLRMALGWELYERTGSAWAIALIGLVQVIPVNFLALPAGHTADRFSRRNICLAGLASQVLAGLGLAWFSFNHQAVGLTYLALFAYATAGTFFNPANAALLPRLVRASRLRDALAYSSGAFQVAAICGPLLGGYLVAHFAGAWAAYLAVGLLLFFGLSCFLLIPDLPHERDKKPVTFHSLSLGLRFVFNEKILLPLLTVDLFAVLFGGAEAMLPVYARDILRVGPVGLGWLGAALNLGSLGMALAITRLPPMRHAGKYFLWSVAGFGLAIITFGLSRWFWLSFLALALAGSLDMVSVVIRATLVQLRMFVGNSNELGWFESGAAAALLSPVLSVVGGGIVTVMVVLLAARKWPGLARLARLESKAGK